LNAGLPPAARGSWTLICRRLGRPGARQTADDAYLANFAYVLPEHSHAAALDAPSSSSSSAATDATEEGKAIDASADEDAQLDADQRFRELSPDEALSVRPLVPSFRTRCEAAFVGCVVTLHHATSDLLGLAACLQEAVLADDRLAGYFADAAMDDLRAHQIAFVSSVAGGPVEYSGEDMRTAHAHLDLDDEDFDAVASHLEAALRENGVRGENVAAIMGEVAALRDPIVGR